MPLTVGHDDLPFLAAPSFGTSPGQEVKDRLALDRLVTSAGRRRRDMLAYVADSSQRLAPRTAPVATLHVVAGPAAPPSAAAVPGLDVAAIDALYACTLSTRTSPAPLTVAATAAARAPSASASSRAATLPRVLRRAVAPGERHLPRAPRRPPSPRLSRRPCPSPRTRGDAM